MPGPLWSVMDARPRIPMTALVADDLPDDAPGVYALYRDGDPAYVGLARSSGWAAGSGRRRRRDMKAEAKPPLTQR